MKGIINLEEIREMSITVPDIVDLAINEFCDKYCKYADSWDEKKEGVELCDTEICRKCPLHLLG